MTHAGYKSRRTVSPVWSVTLGWWITGTGLPMCWPEQPLGHLSARRSSILTRNTGMFPCNPLSAPTSMVLKFRSRGESPDQRSASGPEGPTPRREVRGQLPAHRAYSPEGGQKARRRWQIDNRAVASWSYPKIAIHGPTAARRFGLSTPKVFASRQSTTCRAVATQTRINHQLFSNYLAMQTFFGSVKKRSASSPPSRPTPICFMPPNGTRRSRIV